MCYNPHPVLIKRLQSRAACLLVDHKYRFSTDVVMAPCGKCDECLHQKQNEYFVRWYRQALESNLVQFLTLTYRPQNVPISERSGVVDMDTGEINWQDLRIVSSRSDVYQSEDFKNASKTLRYMKKKPSGVVCTCEKFEFDGFKGIAQYSYSLCREDVRLWLKNCRVRYQRQFGEKLPEFKYSAIGEYGSERARPHVHICFFGLTRKQVAFFADDWRKRYGFTFLESCKARNVDGSDAYAILSRYVSKYVTKGQYECPLVGAGDVEKPRRCQSIGFGTAISENDLKYFAAFDLRFGEYDINTFWCPKLGRYLLESERVEIAQEVSRRCYMSIGGVQYRYKLPLVLMHKLFDVVEYVSEGIPIDHRPDCWFDVGSFDESAELYEPSDASWNQEAYLGYEIKSKNQSSNLYDLVMAIKKTDYCRRMLEEFQQFIESRQDSIFPVDINAEYSAFLRSRSAQKAKAAFEKNRKFYRSCRDKQ